MSSIPTWKLPLTGAAITGSAAASVMRNHENGVDAEYVVTVLVGVAIGGGIGLILALLERRSNKKKSQQKPHQNKLTCRSILLRRLMLILGVIFVFTVIGVTIHLERKGQIKRTSCESQR